MTKFRKTNPDFYNGYFAARVTLYRAATHAPPPPPISYRLGRKEALTTANHATERTEMGASEYLPSILHFPDPPIHHRLDIL